MSDKTVLENVRQVHLFLARQGFKVSYNKVKADVDKGALKPRRGGGYEERTVLAYARAHISRRDIDLSPTMDIPATPDAGAAERRTSADAELKEIGAMRARAKLAQEMGRFTETATIEEELAARAKAFRLGLEKFGHDSAERIAAIFGADGKVAAELVRRLGISEELAVQAIAIVVDHSLSRCSIFTQQWQAEIEKFLDPYATGEWWTDEMRKAWELYEENLHMEVPCV